MSSVSTDVLWKRSLPLRTRTCSWPCRPVTSWITLNPNEVLPVCWLIQPPPVIFAPPLHGDERVRRGRARQVVVVRAKETPTPYTFGPSAAVVDATPAALVVAVNVWTFERRIGDRERDRLAAPVAGRRVEARRTGPTGSSCSPR